MTTPRTRGNASRDRALAAIRALVDTLVGSARKVEKRTGLTNAQLAILRQVVRHGPLTVNEIAAGVRAGQSGVSMVLTRLARAGLVQRLVSSDDRRRVLVEATPLGRRSLRRSPESPTEQLLAALSRLSPAQAAKIADGLDALLRTMQRAAESDRLLFE